MIKFEKLSSELAALEQRNEELVDEAGKVKQEHNETLKSEISKMTQQLNSLREVRAHESKEKESLIEQILTLRIQHKDETEAFKRDIDKINSLLHASNTKIAELLDSPGGMYPFLFWAMHRLCDGEEMREFLQSVKNSHP